MFNTDKQDKFFFELLLAATIAAFLASLLGGCTALRVSNEEYYKGVVELQNAYLPASIQKKCNWNKESVLIEKDNNSFYLPKAHIIYYRKSEDIIHEYSHHLNQTVTKECLDELTSWQRTRIYELRRALKHSIYRDDNGARLNHP